MNKIQAWKILTWLTLGVLCAACSDSKKSESKQASGAIASAATGAVAMDPACNPSFTAQQCAALVGFLDVIKSTQCKPSLSAEQCAKMKAELRTETFAFAEAQAAETVLKVAQLRRIESGQAEPQDSLDRPEGCADQIETIRGLRTLLASPDGTVSNAGMAFLALDVAQSKSKILSVCGFSPEYAPDDVRIKDCQMYRRAAFSLRKMQPASSKDVHSKEESDAIPQKIAQLEQEIGARCGSVETALQASKVAVEQQQGERVVAAQSQTCALQTQELAALKKMQNPSAGEILSQAERDALPGEIARVEQSIASGCK